MKKWIFILLLGGALSAQAAVKSQNLAEKEVLVGINSVFIPSGFDADSDVSVIVSGIFPNGCYKWKDAQVTHKKEKGVLVHDIRSYASVNQGMCIMVLVPFTKEIELGRLGAGHHKLRFISGDGTYLEKDLDIE
ncbi:MAG: hypothetical protein D6797_07985 [Bdellovibrio sp.]|nr:MAG: hypothetical protein D6797_07985 [Bdellovibrio sp.]